MVEVSEYLLLYSRDCPLADTARELLREVGIPHGQYCLEDLSACNPLGNYSSPSLLANGEPIFGTKLEPGIKACTFKLLTEYELLSRVLAGSD